MTGLTIVFHTPNKNKNPFFRQSKENHEKIYGTSKKNEHSMVN